MAAQQVQSLADLLHAGLACEQAGELEAAAGLYRQALAADGAFVDAHVNLAGVLWRLQDFEGTLLHAGHAVRFAPDHALARRMFGAALMHLNRLGEAEAHLRHALQLQPGLHSAQLDLAFTLLLAGRLREGFALYEQRWRDPRLARPAFWRAAHEWPGPSAPLAGKAIAVYGEQGRGDVLQFLRYLPPLQALGATVYGIFAPDVVDLVEESFPGVACLRPGRDLQVEWHAALMDLPARFGTTLESLPAQVPYLRVPAAARAAWAARLQPWRGLRKVGLAWSGAPIQANNRNRSMALGELVPIATVPGLRFFSLQKDGGGAWTDVPLPPGMVDLTTDWAGFVDSAAMIEQLDLVITVDTAVAHLAGALGKPVWMLLPPNADWRWMVDREDSPWYPTARLFRRAHGEPRAAQVRRVRDALVAFHSGVTPATTPSPRSRR